MHSSDIGLKSDGLLTIAIKHYGSDRCFESKHDQSTQQKLGVIMYNPFTFDAKKRQAFTRTSSFAQTLLVDKAVIRL